MLSNPAIVCFTLCCLNLITCACGTALADDSPKVPSYHEHQNLGYYLDAQGRPHAIKTVDDWKIRRQHILAGLEKVMGPFPQPETKVPLNVQVLEDVQLDGLIRRKISYHTDSVDRRVMAYLFLPSRDSSKLPAMLCLHQTTGPGKREPAGLDGNPHLHYALELARRGYVTLAPDYPSFGEYEYDFRPEYGYISGSMKAIYDNTRAVDLLASMTEVDAEKIGCIGHSLGGHNAMFTAVFEQRIKAIVSCCGFTRFHKYYKGDLRGWTSARYMPRIATEHDMNPDQVPFDFPEIVACFAPRAFFTCSPLRDDNFEVSGVVDTMFLAQPIFDLHGTSKNLQAVYPDSHHDFPNAAREQAYQFLDQHFRPGGPG